MKIIFLDFDGVLNSVRSAHAFGGYPWNINPESIKQFDPIALTTIRNFCNDYDIKIVVSSTWRKSFSPEDLGKALDLPIIDKTPDFHMSRSRGLEIQSWFVNNPGEYEYAIIDDDSDMLETQLTRFIQTDPYEGFGWKNLMQLYSLFNIPYRKRLNTKQRIK
jgi:hypothetical protein